MEGIKLSDLIVRIMRCDLVIYQLYEKLERDRNRGDLSGAEILYWQLHGVFSALKQLELYTEWHRQIENRCEKFYAELVGGQKDVAATQAQG